MNERGVTIWIDGKSVSVATLIAAYTETDAYRLLLEEQERELVEGKASGIPIGLISKI